MIKSFFCFTGKYVKFWTRNEILRFFNLYLLLKNYNKWHVTKILDSFPALRFNSNFSIAPQSRTPQVGKQKGHTLIQPRWAAPGRDQYPPSWSRAAGARWRSESAPLTNLDGKMDTFSAAKFQLFIIIFILNVGDEGILLWTYWRALLEEHFFDFMGLLSVCRGTIAMEW